MFKTGFTKTFVGSALSLNHSPHSRYITCKTQAPDGPKEAQQAVLRSDVATILVASALS
jgi:hypothetical protein